MPIDRKKREILKSLRELYHIDKIASEELFLKFHYKPIHDFIDSLKSKGKPETAASELLRSLLRDVIDEKVMAEVNFQGDFIDYIVQTEGKGNPVCIELKPFFRLEPNGNFIKQADFKYPPHQAQIQKYLRHKQVEYVILTNVHKAYIFNRAALIDFKPFAETTLADIFEKNIQVDNLWDVLRQFEDQHVEVNLDSEFFQDLKKWFAEFAYIDFKKETVLSKEETIVLFLNKFIFIKTLEDYGLVPYRFIQDEYEGYVSKWKAKGYGIVFRQFFNEIESFFEIYYDTELFTSNFWDYIEEDEENVERFRKVFEMILGLDSWSQTFGKGLVHYNYRQIDEDIFGKAYETWIAENRKDEGIFYTHTKITEYMADKIVNSLFDVPVSALVVEINKNSPDSERLDELIAEIRKIKIIDSTSGSGSFLIKVLRAVYRQYERIDDATRWVKEFAPGNLFNVPDNIVYAQAFREKMYLNGGAELVFISTIILNHIFAADKDERAIDTAKTNIWKEAVKLNPSIYNYRRLDNKKIHILPNLELNFIKGDSLTDFDFDRQIEIISSEFKGDIAELFKIRSRYIADPYNPKVIDAAMAIKKKIRKRLVEEHPDFPDSLFYPLEFFYCFFEPSGAALPKEQRGFDGIISNPPWEAIKPVKKEFAKLGKNEMDILHFNEWFDKEIKKNESFRDKWNKYVEYYSNLTEYLYGKYSNQSSGDPNLYKFFMERDLQLVKEKGLFCLLVPSGFQTDEGSDKLRDLLINKSTLLELSSFENRGFKKEDKKHKEKIFPEVDSRFKFSIVYARKESGGIYDFKAKFYLHDPKDLYNEEFITYNIEKIKQFSPDNLSIMEFKTEDDFDLCLKIKGNNIDFNETGHRLRREFDMTNDSSLFHSLDDIKRHKTKPFLRLYEGKMIHQYCSSYDMPRYFIREEEARIPLLRKVISRIKSDNKIANGDFNKIQVPEDLILDYQTYRLCYRAIARSTDERTLICSIVPPNVFIGHSMSHFVNVDYTIEDNKVYAKPTDNKETILFMCLFNSLVLNYYIRNKISANLTMNFIYELPIAEASDSDRQRIIELGMSLLFRKTNSADMKPLADETGLTLDLISDETSLRAELEVIIAKKLYKLDKSDWEHLTSTFTFGGVSHTKAELDEIIKKSIDIWANI